MLRKKSAGFTLIELTIVLAITGALAVFVIKDQYGASQQSKFTTTIDSVANSIQGISNGVATNDNYPQESALAAAHSGSYANENDAYVLYARTITAVPGQSYITVTDVIGFKLGGNPQTNQDCGTSAGSVSPDASEQIFSQDGNGTILETSPYWTPGVASGVYAYAPYSYKISLNYGVTVYNPNPTNPTITAVGIHRPLCGGQLTTTDFSATGSPASTLLTNIQKNMVTRSNYSEDASDNQNVTFPLISPQNKLACVTLEGTQNSTVTVSYPTGTSCP